MSSSSSANLPVYVGGSKVPSYSTSGGKTRTFRVGPVDVIVRFWVSKRSLRHAALYASFHCNTNVAFDASRCVASGRLARASTAKAPAWGGAADDYGSGDDDSDGTYDGGGSGGGGGGGGGRARRSSSKRSSSKATSTARALPVTSVGFTSDAAAKVLVFLYAPGTPAYLFVLILLLCV